jgi:fumarate reductase subunit D
MKVARSHPLWLAYLLHRVSGLALALFLPAHFWVLALALTGPARLDGFLSWTDAPLVKFAEAGLVFLLAAHAFGGLRLMALEHLGWTARQKTAVAAVVAGALCVAGLFGLRAI